MREAMFGQAFHIIFNDRNQRSGADGDRAGKAQMMLSHANFDGRADQDAGLLGEVFGNPYWSDDVRADHAIGAMLFMRTNRHDDALFLLQILFGLAPSQVLEVHCDSPV